MVYSKSILNSKTGFVILTYFLINLFVSIFYIIFLIVTCNCDNLDEQPVLPLVELFQIMTVSTYNLSNAIDLNNINITGE